MSAPSIWNQGFMRERAAVGGLARTSGASPRFADDAEILSRPWRYEAHDPTILLGHHAGQLIGLARDDRHCLTVAGSRGGKGISLIIPNLILWPGSCLVLDPKGELARKTARARRELHRQKVVVLDPFGVSGQPGGSCNLLDGLDPSSPTFLPDLRLLMESLIVSSSSVSDGDHWASSGRLLASTAIIHTLLHWHRPTLSTVWEVLNGTHGTLLGTMAEPSDVFGYLLECDDLNGSLRAAATRWLEIHPKEQSSILSTTRQQLAWLEGLNSPDAPMTRVNAPSDFRLADLKRQDVTVYLCLPASYLEAYRPWMRAFVNMAMAALENTPARPAAPPVLLLLDEFATLGHMASLEKAAGLLAGAGVKLWPIVQDLGQLKSVYGERWGTFIGNAGVTTWFALGGDELTADYLSRRVGVTQYYEAQEAGGAFMDRARAGLLRGGGQWVTSPLLHPHEIERAFARETGRLLALSPGAPPLVLDRVNILNGFLKEWIDD